MDNPTHLPGFLSAPRSSTRDILQEGVGQIRSYPPLNPPNQGVPPILPYHRQELIERSISQRASIAFREVTVRTESLKVRQNGHPTLGERNDVIDVGGVEINSSSTVATFVSGSPQQLHSPRMRN